jgi:transcriptional regulator with XRE-family HTH domain
MVLIEREKFIQQLRQRREALGLAREKLAETIRNKHNSKLTTNTIAQFENGTLRGNNYDYLYQLDDVITDFEKSQNNSKNLANTVNENHER